MEIRPLMEADDFGDQLTPELWAQESQLRSTVAAFADAPAPRPDGAA